VRERIVLLLLALWCVPGIGLPTGPVRAEDWSWAEAQAEVDPKGDLGWSPRPFVFEGGTSVRYVDYESGDDASDGATKDRAWKHHPWDPASTGKARECHGVHTYVFKRGVIYRGNLVAAESGTPDEPIRLTSDPTWGAGEAVICGSERVRRWTKGADHRDIPEPEHVWWTDLDFSPRCVWMIGQDGGVVRIPLARTPNWQVSDPDDVKSEWWHWNYPTGKPFDVFAEKGGRRLHLGVDTEHLTKSADYYRNAIVWTEHGWVAGAPYPVRVELVDTARKGLGFGGRWGGVGSYKIVKFNRYYLEDKPHYLDDPEGEFWFHRRGDGGRLYIRLPGDADPNSAHIEAARHLNLIDSKQMNHVHITGLTFRFTNAYWRLDGVPYADGTDLDPACIRLLGSGQDIRVANCVFEHVNTGVRMKAIGRGDAIDRVVISDNEVRFTDRGGFIVEDGSAWGEVLRASGVLHDVKVLRNSLRQIGLRPTRFGSGPAISVTNAETLEIAGNIIDRCYSIGINVRGAKRTGASWDCPLVRILIHHNKVTNSLLSTDDYGGIETWQGGPAYVYNNISGNPGGYRHFWLLSEPPRGARFGHAYYLDGAFKNFHFNNIAWGKSMDSFSRLGNTAAFQEIHSYQNTFFNNTIYRFVKGSRRQAPQAGRDKFLGNVWDSIGDWVFWHAHPARTPEEGNAADAGPQRSHFAYETNAYSRNVFHDIMDQFGVFEPSGRWHASLESFRNALQGSKAMASSVGEVVTTPPLRDPAKHDFRLAPNSPAIDKGVRVFVPWGLAAEVAEWNFYHTGDDPSRIIDEHWYMTPYHVQRQDYYVRPMYPLTAVNVRASDYVAGPLEDWTAGALRLNGRDQYAAIANARLTEPFHYELTFLEEGKPRVEKRTAAGADLKSPQIHMSSFLIEAYLRTEPGHTGGVLIEKLSGAGYSLAVDDSGGVTFTVKGEADGGSVASETKINDGRWHHVIAECDRESRTLTLYVDGSTDASAPGVGPDTTLENGADLYVGGTPGGRCLAGDLDFMRIRGTVRVGVQRALAEGLRGTQTGRGTAGRGGHRAGGLTYNEARLERSCGSCAALRDGGGRGRRTRGHRIKSSPRTSWGTGAYPVDGPLSDPARAPTGANATGGGGPRSRGGGDTPAHTRNCRR